MVVIALLLIAAGVAAAAGVLLGGNTDAVEVQAFGQVVPHATVLAVFGAGAGAMFLALLGVGILRGTARRSIARRNEVRELREQHEETMRRLEQENASLHEELRLARHEPAYGRLSDEPVDQLEEQPPRSSTRPPADGDSTGLAGPGATGSLSGRGSRAYDGTSPRGSEDDDARWRASLRDDTPPTYPRR